VTGRAYLSIGDVLTLLRQEFPDVTISKIRFLESQGLVDPERTPSGYRKFYEPDVERLRWVLRQQREHFLPLKVIKGRLEEVGERTGNGHTHERPSRPAAGHPSGAEAGPGALSLHSARPGRAESTLPGLGLPETRPRPKRGPETHPAAARPAPGHPPETRAEPPRPAPAAAGRGPAGPAPAGPVPKARPGSEPMAAAAAPAPAVPPPAVLDSGDMTLEELASASGCSAAAVAALESYGLLGSRLVGGVRYYDESALAVARLAGFFAAFGVEPRHLRLHKHAAEREAGFVEQVVMPLFRQRNPESRQKAHEAVAELSRLGQELRAVLLARTLRDQLGG
jgi:DNA-binding transcriptional MerR regulator